MVTEHKKEIKKALKKELNPNIFTYSKYRLSPYSSCEHGCLYCDGRAEKYFVQGEFDRDIVIRKNIPDILEKEIPLLRERGQVSIGSGITDVYQPVEKSHMLMRRTGEILAESNLPVLILTKSTLIGRDIDLWSRVNEKNGFTLLVSINSLDNRVGNKFEPGASGISERLNLITEFKKAGCSVGVLCMPLLPFITDNLDSIESLISEVKGRGADFIMPGVLTLRPGRQKNHYLKSISDEGNNLLSKYENLYSNELSSGMPHGEYSSTLFYNFYKALKKEMLPFFLPHKNYQGKLEIYDELYILLHQMLEVYKYAGVNTANLFMALGRYTEWLTNEKRSFNRKRSLNSSYISDILKFKLKTDEFEKILNNKKLTEFIKEVVFNKKIFDPVSRSLG